MSSFFFDSNICVYMFDGAEPAKQDKAIALLKDTTPRISSQVVIETYLACSRILKLPKEVCEQNVRMLCCMMDVFSIRSQDFELAICIKNQYQLSFLDSVAAVEHFLFITFIIVVIFCINSISLAYDYHLEEQRNT